MILLDPIMSKKEFKERTSIHVYGRGERRRVALYYDWLNDVNKGVGFKFMLKGYGCTKAEILKDAYDILILKNHSELCWYDIKTVEHDKDRFKVQLVG